LFFSAIQPSDNLAIYPFSHLSLPASSLSTICRLGCYFFGFENRTVMQIFTEKDKLITVIRSNYHLLPVINRFGIRLGVKDKTVGDICREKQINPLFFLAVVNTFHNVDYFPKTDLLTVSPLQIVAYLRKTHQYYLEYEVLKIERLLEKLLLGCPTQCTDLKMIDSFYRKYKKELFLHIMEEEEKVFPYIISLTQNRKRIPGYSISSYEKEHSDVDSKLNDLTSLVIKYLEPAYNDNDCNEFLIALSKFERDLADHARIEDNVLVPLVLELEKELGDE